MTDHDQIGPMLLGHGQNLVGDVFGFVQDGSDMRSDRPQPVCRPVEIIVSLSALRLPQIPALLDDVHPERTDNRQHLKDNDFALLSQREGSQPFHGSSRRRRTVDCNKHPFEPACRLGRIVPWTDNQYVAGGMACESVGCPSQQPATNLRTSPGTGHDEVRLPIGGQLTDLLDDIAGKDYATDTAEAGLQPLDLAFQTLLHFTPIPGQFLPQRRMFVGNIALPRGGFDHRHEAQLAVGRNGQTSQERLGSLSV